jgi:hypothetical protein
VSLTEPPGLAVLAEVPGPTVMTDAPVLTVLAGTTSLTDVTWLAQSLHGPVTLGLVAAGLAAAAVLVLLGGRPDADPPDRQRPDTGLDAADVTGGAAGASEGTAPGGHTPPLRGLRRLGRRQGTDHGDADDAQVSSALALLALAYRSGLPTWDVLEAVAAGLTGRASADLRQVATALRWGAAEPEAWASVGRVWAPAARAVAIAHQAGVPPGAMLLAASDDLRAAELERLEVSAAKVGVRLVAPLGLVLLPAFCLTTVAPLVIALAGDLLTG